MKLDRASKGAVLFLCAYEAAAILTGRVPTVSSLCRRYRWAEAGLLAVLAVHLHYRSASL